MESALADLAQALRERLAIIHNEESRRNADAHMHGCGRSRKKSKSCKRRYRNRSILDWRIISSAAATTKRWNSWKIRSGAHGGERRSILVPALLANRNRIANGFDQAPIPFSC